MLGNHTEELRIETAEKQETYKILKQKAKMFLRITLHLCL